MTQVAKEIKRECQQYKDALIAEIPRLSNLDIVKQIDIALLDSLSTIVSDMLQSNPKPITDSVAVSKKQLVDIVGKEIPIEIMELLALHVSRSGWKVYRHHIGGRLDTLAIVPNLSDLDV